MINPITYNTCSIHFVNQDFTVLDAYIHKQNYSKVFVLVDNNTHIHCLPLLTERLSISVDVIRIESGEETKNITTSLQVWEALSNLGADKKSLLINLGGGVVTDLGGFVASTFRRGIDYINIPTTLLAMVDAAIGGKTGVDLGNLKNQIGLVRNPKMVLIDTFFLKTLSEDEKKSGMAEMLKHGLIDSKKHWLQLTKGNMLSNANSLPLIYDSIQIKKQIVTQDPSEDGIRKALNFGHTLGHAIETYALSKKEIKPLLHGEAVAIGIIMESYISSKLTSFSVKDCDEVKRVILSQFKQVIFPESSYKDIIELTAFDKKNTFGNVNFVLLEDIGKPKLDCRVDKSLIIEAFKFYNS